MVFAIFDDIFVQDDDFIKEEVIKSNNRDLNIKIINKNNKIIENNKLYY